MRDVIASKAWQSQLDQSKEVEFLHSWHRSIQFKTQYLHFD
jgi:hypothetical protein